MEDDLLKTRLDSYSKRGIFLGTSSWKYPGWMGQVYSRDRYEYRNRWSKMRFDRTCLNEYSETFPTVCFDGGFYRLPTPQMLRANFDQLPDGFRFSIKIPEEITVERWPQQKRYGQRAGIDNGHFMDATLLNEQLLEPLMPYHNKLGVLIFEFGTIYDSETAHPDVFARKLHNLLSRIPTDRFRFAVEVRNPSFLCDQYFRTLRDHRVAHCFNSWSRMPSVLEQLRHDGALTADFSVARFLLRPGRTYQQAVNLFEPYEHVQEPYPQGREAMVELIRQSTAKQIQLYVYVNNRLEGNAVQTIEEVLAANLDWR